MKIEWWKYINGYEGLYMVSTFGRVKNSKTGKILKPTLNKNGYLYVRLGRGRNIAVHRLVAEAFKPNPHNYPTVDHISRIKTDNRVENLRWAPWELQTKNSDHTKVSQYNKKYASKAVIQYTLDMVFVAEYPSAAEAERQTGINYNSICECCRGVKYRHTAGGYIWTYKEKGT